MNQKISILFASVFLAVLGWIWSATYTRLTSMESELVAIKIELVKVQSQIVDRAEVVKIVQEQLHK